MSQGRSVAPYAYSASDHNGITGAYMAMITNGELVPMGPVLVTDTSPTGAITPDTATPPAAPATAFRRTDHAVPRRAARRDLPGGQPGRPAHWLRGMPDLSARS